jgi:hypothetical protein
MRRLSHSRQVRTVAAAAKTAADQAHRARALNTWRISSRLTATGPGDLG